MDTSHHTGDFKSHMDYLYDPSRPRVLSESNSLTLRSRFLFCVPVQGLATAIRIAGLVLLSLAMPPGFATGAEPTAAEIMERSYQVSRVKQSVTTTKWS